jgi:hypothetical protein
MIIVASELDPSSKRIVEYLSEVHGVSINTLFFRTFEHDGKMMIAADWLIDEEEVATRAAKRNKKPEPWTGFWYVNADNSPYHNWEDCRRCGFLGAGGGRVYSNPLRRLEVGAQVFVYQAKAGYVGYGIVNQTVQPASEFVVNGKPLSECAQLSTELLHDSDNPDLQDYVVGVEWKKAFPIKEGKAWPGGFTSPQVVCKLNSSETLAVLKREFGVP